MEMRLNKKYLGQYIKAELFKPAKYEILPPNHASELAGYVMYVLEDDIQVSTDSFTILQGNEYNPKIREWIHMFEKQVKVKGRAFKRYRYTDDELYTLYGRESKSFDRRYQERDVLLQGPGKLVLSSYSKAYQENGATLHRQAEEWMLIPQESDIWAYEFGYDPLRDTGKHRITAKGFSILEEYSIPDMAIFHDNYQVLSLLHNLQHIRNLSLKTPSLYDRFYYNSYGKFTSAQNMAEYIALSLYQTVPEDITAPRKYGTFQETEQGARIREGLTRIMEQAVTLCQNEILAYQTAEIKKIIQEIQKLTGLSIKNNLTGNEG